MAWADRTLREFQDALASSEPTPGGGSAAVPGGSERQSCKDPGLIDLRRLSETRAFQ